MAAARAVDDLGAWVAEKYRRIPSGAKILSGLTMSSHRTGESYIRRDRNLGLPAAIELALRDPEFKAVLINILEGNNATADNR